MVVEEKVQCEVAVERLEDSMASKIMNHEKWHYVR